MCSPFGNLASGLGAADGVDISEALVLCVFNRALSIMFLRLSLLLSVFINSRPSKAGLGILSYQEACIHLQSSLVCVLFGGSLLRGLEEVTN